MSQALDSFQGRMKEVQQLLDAHTALTRLRRAEAALNAGGQTLQGVAQVVQHLVSAPGPGRPREVHALNSAGIALLSAHLQGYVVDLFKEVANETLTGKVRNVVALIEVANTRGNPNEANITQLFQSIGYPRVLDGITWQRMNNNQLRAKLRTFNELRNKIVHGTAGTVKKSALKNYLDVFSNLAERLDGKLRREVRAVIGANPW
jgi:HEPN superfamily RiboL-PSP-like protein